MSGTVVLAALLAVAGMVALSRSPVAATQISADPVFIQSANSACSQAMGQIRVTADAKPTTTSGEVATPAATDRANRALSALVAKLQSLRSAAGLGTQLEGWFNDWARFARSRAAEAAMAAGDPRRQALSPATKALVVATNRAAGQADSFALGNSLGECVLGSA